MGTRTGASQDIDEELLSHGVVCLTGGHDSANTPLLTFPASAHSQLEIWTSSRLERLLRHYVRWLSMTSNVQTVACLADLQQASKDVIKVIVEAVEGLESNSRGTVNTLYFLKPQNKSKSKFLKKLLGLKHCAKHPKIPLFRVILLKSYQDVFSQIELCHLTSDFGGCLTYDHAAWIKFHQEVAPCICEAVSVLKRLPELRDRVELLQDYEIYQQTAADIQTLLTELTESYNVIVNKAHFQEALDRCKQTLLLLDGTDANEKWLTRIHAWHVRRASERVRELYENLDTQRSQFEQLWRGIKENITVHLQIQNHRERAAEIEKRIKSHYERLMPEHPFIGSTLSEAELYRTHFTTTLYEPAKELLSQATKILEDVQKLRERAKPPCDVTDILELLTVALQPFTQTLQAMQDIYVEVHIFHLLFQKAQTWYRKVLKFLPDGLQERVAGWSGSMVVQMPPEWQATVYSFLSKHPPPGDQHLARLDTEIPPQVEKSLRVQARLLSHRLRLLQRLLRSRRLSVTLLSTIFRWKAEINSGGQGITSEDKERNNPKTASASGEKLANHPQGAQKQKPNSSPPAKPVRLFDTMKSSSSFSSSDTGELDYINMHFLDHTVYSIPNSCTEDEVADPNGGGDEEESSCGILKYQKPPNLNVKIVSANHGSSSHDSDQSESKSADSADSLEQRQSGERTPEYERFIRLTFSPSATPSSRRHSNGTDGSLDSEDLGFRFPDVLTGSESGIEVAETEDPWDSIIDRIKAVSNSYLPSDVKIQFMSRLLSQSKVSDPISRQRPQSSRRLNFDQQRRNGDTPGPRRGSAGFEQLKEHIIQTQDIIVNGNRDDTGPHLKGRPIELHTRGLYDGWRFSSAVPLEHRQKFHAMEHERPAYIVARMRQRLASSLQELDQYEDSKDVYRDVRSFVNTGADRQQREIGTFTQSPRDGDGSFFRREGRRSSWWDNHSYVALSRRRNSDLGSGYGRYRPDSASNPQVGLDRVHSSRHESWRSHEVGLDSLNHRNNRPLAPSSKVFSTSLDSGLNSVKPSGQQQQQQQQHQQAAGSATPRKNPYRWRQGIVVELPRSSAKERHKPKDFSASSFPKPFHSMHNLNLQADHSAGGLSLFPGHCYSEGGSQVDGRDPAEGQRALESDSSSETCQRRQNSSLDRLSDEVGQEDLSQDEVESSLKRSERILMEAEEQLRETTQTSLALGEDDTTSAPEDVAEHTDQSVQPECIPGTCKQSEGLESQHHDLDETTEFQINGSPRNSDDELEVWEGSTIASDSPQQEFLTFGELLVDVDCDADVSNMSDACSDGRQQQ